MEKTHLNLLKTQFNNKIEFREKRPGIEQLLAPFYYEDGNMIDIFIEQSPETGKIRICDYGMVLMHLSYSYEIDTPNKGRIFQNIISENSLDIEDGNIFIDVQPSQLYAGVFQFAQTVAKISSMAYFKREVIQNLFYEMLEDFIDSNFSIYSPIKSLLPIEERDDLEVDFALTQTKKPIYLFGVKDSSKARLVTICCLKFQRAQLPFKSIVVHKEFDSLPKKDRSRLTSAADKQFIDLDDFRKHGEEYLKREAS